MFLKKQLCILIAIFPAVVLGIACSTVAFAETESLSLSAEAAVVYCVNTGQTLYSHNGEQQMAMASTTKIMTALLTLEEASQNDKVVTITEEMIAVEGSSMGLKAGDQLPLSALAAGMLTVSGNDAANAAAIAIDGTTEQFARRMNERAARLEMAHTHFVTPSGLDDAAHYSTASDMAKLGAAAIQTESFRALCSQTAAQVSFVSPQKTVTLTNHNRLLRLYKGCIGMKTGFTKKAGRCLVSAAERNGILLVAVTLNAPDDWNDHIALLDYGFSKVQPMEFPALPERFSVPVVGGTAEQVLAVTGSLTEHPLVETGQQPEAHVQLPRFLYAPVQQGAVVGRIVYTVDGNTVAEAPLLAEEVVAPAEIKRTFWQSALWWFIKVFS